MRSHVNLMSDAARFRVAARRRVKRWTIGLLLLMVGLTAWSAQQWIRCGAVQQQYEALEARYEPIRQLNAMNRGLRSEAATLLQRDKVPLQLSRRPSAAALMELVSRAVKKSKSQAFISRIGLSPNEAVDPVKLDSGKLDLEAITQVDGSVDSLVAELKKAPFLDVKVLSSQVVAHEGHDRKVVAIECRY